MKQTEHPIKRRRRWPWITLAIVVVLMVFVRLAMQSDYVMNRIRVEVETRASEMLNAELQIGRMQGDLWSQIMLEDIRLYDESGQNPVSIDTLSVSWSVFNLIFRRPLEIQKVHVLGLRADIKQEEDGTWNILQLLPEAEEAPVDEEPFQFVLKEARITAPMISVDAAAVMPDAPVSLRDMELLARLGQNEDGFYIDLHQFDLSVDESRLDAPVQLESEAAWDGRRITLDRLVVAGAHSLINAAGNYDTITQGGDLEAAFDPLAWQQVAAYLDTYPVRQDLTVSLRAGGSRQDLHAGITVNAPGLENFSVDTRWSIMQEPVLNGLEIASDRIDYGMLTGADTLRAQVGTLSFSIDGAIPFNEWDRVSLNGNLSIRDLQFQDHRLDEITMDLSAQNGIVRTETVLRKGGESIRLELAVERWWEPDTDWTLAYQIEKLNPAFWSGMEALEGSVTSSGSLSGSGLEPGTIAWIAEIEVGHFRMADYPEVSLTLNGEITADSLHAVADIRVADGQIDLITGMLWSLEKPEYTLDMHFVNLNVGMMAEQVQEQYREQNLAERKNQTQMQEQSQDEEQEQNLEPEADEDLESDQEQNPEQVAVQENLTTNINGTFNLTGEGFHPETMTWEASLVLDDSELNRQKIESIELDLAMEDGFLQITEGTFNSSVIRGSLSLVQNIFDLKDPLNRLEFDLELLDLQGFAGLAGTDSLQAKGSVTGSIRPKIGGDLAFQSRLDLVNVQYDSIRVQKLDGSVNLDLADEMNYHIDVTFNSPSVGQYTIQDVYINTNGLITESGFTGGYELTFNVESTSGLRTLADYDVGDTIRIHTREMELTDPAGKYLLQQPFDVILADGYVLVDTLHLASDRESVVTAYLHKSQNTPWTGFFDATDTDLGQIQYVFLEEPYFDAMFTGRFAFTVDTDTLALDGEVEISGFVKDEVELDSLHLAFNVDNKRIVIDAGSWHLDRELLRAEFDLPFEHRDPVTLGDEFFEEPVSGYLNVHPVDISHYKEWLTTLGLEEISGEFSIEMTLNGNAGAPELIGELKLIEGTLSGVSIDTLLVAWDYDHNRDDVMLTSRVHSLGQRAADISGRVPLYIDIRSFDVQGPQPDDHLEVSVFTSEFDLAAFNEFLNPEQIEGLQGKLNAKVDIGGSISDPELAGSLLLEEGQLSLIQNNITLRSFRFDIGLEPGNVKLNQLSVQSVGSFNGEGNITLEGLTPDEVDLRFEASNFRVYNTRDIEIYTIMNLQLAGTFERPMLTGGVRWERGVLYVDDFGEREVEEVVLEEDEEEVPAGPDFYERMGMEVKFSVDRNAFVRNRRDPQVDLALSGEIDLLKQPFGELQLFGEISIPSGEVTTFNRKFEMEEGNVIFSGDPANPQLNIRTLYQPRQQYDEIKIYYIITGTVSDPEFAYESEPEMELQDIISYTIFGRPFHALAGWEQTVSGRSNGGNMATNIAVEVLLDRIENLASDRLGIDVIEIENTRKGGGSGTSIKAGKYITDRLFIAFLQELGGSEAGRQVVIEYLIRRNLELIITGSDDYRSGVDMLWRYDY